MKNVVVTGATSMIGVALIQALLDHHGAARIYAVVRKGSPKAERLPEDSRITIVACDINEYEQLPELVGDSCDVFYHFAWKSTGRREVRNTAIVQQEQNIRFALDALAAAKALGCTKFIGAGSQAEFGPLDLRKISPDSPADPIEAYGIAKLAAGKLVRMQAKLWGMDCLWARIFSVYGKFDQPTTMISSTLRKLLDGKIPEFTPAEQRWDYLNEKDAGEAFYLIGERAHGNKVYCLGSGQARSLKEYIEEMRDMIDPTRALGFGKLPYPQHPVMNLCADISALQKDTKWGGPSVSFAAGIKDILSVMHVERRKDQ